MNLLITLLSSRACEKPTTALSDEAKGERGRKLELESESMQKCRRRKYQRAKV